MAAPQRMPLIPVVVWSSLAGCSLLYDPSGLPAPAIDAAPPPDQPTIVNANGLALEAAGPRVLLEGQGVGGSRAAILAIVGANIAEDAKLALVATDGSAAPMIEIDHDHAVRSPSGTGIAVPIVLPVDPTRAAGDVKLTVQITQAGTDGVVMARLEDQVTLRALPELITPVTDGAALAPLYSRVRLTAALSFAAKAGAEGVVLRAVSSIELRDVHADAVANVPGPGGAAGGAVGKPGGGPGGGAGASTLGGGVIAPAAGGGYGEPGGVATPVAGNPILGGAVTGDELITSFASNGGSGGGGSGLLGTTPGGGGGGSLEITAGGTLQAGAISVNGGAGGADALLSGAGAGGSGGAIILRAGAAATVAKVTATGGPGGPHTFNPAAVPGAGGGGRLRYDVGALVGTPELPVVRRPGVSFDVGAIPLVTTDADQGVSVTSVVSGHAPSNVFDVYVFNAALATTDAQTFMFVTPSVILKPKLGPGYNRVCVTPHDLNPLTATAVTNCIDLAYVP